MFKIGQKVVYIQRKIDASHWGQITPEPKAIYTVRAVGFAYNIPAIWLEEIVNEPRAWADGVYELGMNAEFFRPLVENKSEVSFTTGADPSSEQWDNRVHRTVRA